MRLRNLLMIAGAVAAIAIPPAFADLTYTQGSGTTLFDFICFTTKHCSTHVNINSAGTEIMTTSNPAQIDWSTSSQAHTDATAPIATQSSTVSIGGVGLFSGGVIMGNTNGLYSNLLQGNSTLSASNPIFVTPVPNTTGGWTKWSTPKNNSNTALTTTVVAVKSSAAGVFGGYYISNPNASVACVQVFDVATAGGVTLGTTRPDLVFCIPASSAANFEMVNGAAMANGIQIAATTTASGSSAPGSGLDVSILYK